MRTVSGSDSALLRTGDVRVWVANSSGTLVDQSASLVSVEYEDPSADQPIGAATITLRRGDGASSLAPLMSADPPIDIKRAVMVDIDPGSGTYREVFRGKIDRVDWRNRFGDVVIECRDQAGDIQDTFIESVRTYGSDDGVALETVIQSVFDDNLASAPTLYTPTATSAVVTPMYEQQQEATFQATRTLAESIGWTHRYRFIEALSGWRMTLFEPSRSKTVADHTFGTSDYYDVSEINLNVDEIRNAIEVESPNTDGSRGSSLVEDSASITKYGRRYMKIVEGDDSPIVGATKRLALANAALSDLAEPDAVLEITSKYFWPGEVGVDLYTFTANDKHFSSSQTLAPVAIRHKLAVGERWESRIMVRGKPSGGQYQWRDRARRGSTRRPSEMEEYGLVDFREVVASAAGKRRFQWTRRGRQVAEVWWGYEVFDAESGAASDDKWATVVAGVEHLPTAQNYVEVAAPASNEYGLLQVEPRVDRGSSVTPFHGDVIERRELYPVPANVNLSLRAAIVSNAVDLTAQVAATTSSYPVTVVVWEDAETTGTQLASFTFTADGSKTKADDADMGGRRFPANGKKVWIAVATDVAGNVYRDKAEVSRAKIPTLRIRQTAGGTNFQSDLHVEVDDENALGGTLTAWLNRAASGNANPDGAADGTYSIASTPTEVGPLDTGWSTGTALLNDVWVYPGRGKWVYFEFTNSDGASSGQVGFQLQNWLDLVDENGDLGDDKITRPASFAASIRPPKVVDTLPVDNTDSNLMYLTTDRKLYRWNGTGWTASVATSDLSGTISTAQIADAAITAAKIGAAAVETAKLANEAVTSAILAAGAVTETKITDSSVSTAKIAADAVTAAKIAAGTITSSEIASNTIVAGNIAAGTITTTEIAADTITAANIAALTITAAEIAANTITAAKIAAGTITTTEIAADTIVAGNIAAGAVGADEIAAVSITASKLNVATHFLQGITWTSNSPSAGRVAWSAGTLIHKGVSYSITAGDTSDAVIWWDLSTPTAFQTATEGVFDTYVELGTFNPLEDAVVAFNESGSAREVWNGTMLAGSTIITGTVSTRNLKADSVTAAKIAAYTMEVGKYIQSSNYVAGSAGWRIDDDLAEFSDVTIRGTLEGATGTFAGALSASTIDTQGTLRIDLGARSYFEDPGLKWSSGSNHARISSSNAIDIDLVPPSGGYVDFKNMGILPTGKTATGGFLPIKIEGNIRYLEVFS